MATDYKTTGFPPTFVNAYVLAKLAEFGLIAEEDLLASNLNPMVPAQFPTNIEDLYNDTLQIRQTASPLLLVYDRLMRFRSSAFYRNKKEQLVYFVYSSDLDKLINTIRVITDVLDREDAAAQDINSWCKNNMTDFNVFFHNVKVYQADESRDVAELASARTLFVNKIIIEYDYHTVDGMILDYTYEAYRQELALVDPGVLDPESASYIPPRYMSTSQYT